MTSETEARIRIVIAEDQALVRRGTALLLSLEPDMEVVGLASDGVEAVALAQSLHPDIILMDLHMPRKGGVAATREISLTVPGAQVLVLTTLNDDETVFEAVRAGAHGYLLKDATEEELLETIRALRRGESRLTPQIARKVMDQFRRLARSSDYPRVAQDAAGDTSPDAPASRGPASVIETLSEKEEKILNLITEGRSNRQIAVTLVPCHGNATFIVDHSRCRSQRPPSWRARHELRRVQKISHEYSADGRQRTLT
jgi:DNA-binding NarL/FixJ family response regulator